MNKADLKKKLAFQTKELDRLTISIDEDRTGVHVLERCRPLKDGWMMYHFSKTKTGRKKALKLFEGLR